MDDDVARLIHIAVRAAMNAEYSRLVESAAFTAGTLEEKRIIANIHVRWRLQKMLEKPIEGEWREWRL